MVILESAPIRTADIRWVTKWAQKICVAGKLPYADTEDVIQEALLALVKGWSRYDPERGEFRTYVSERILRSIRDAIRNRRGRPGSLRQAATHVDVDKTLYLDERVSPAWRRPRKVRGGRMGVRAR